MSEKPQYPVENPRYFRQVMRIKALGQLAADDIRAALVDNFFEADVEVSDDIS